MDVLADDQLLFDLEKLQNEIELKERSLNISINRSLIALDANIQDLRSLIDQKRVEEKIYKSSICDLWLRLKLVEQMGPISLITFLRKIQLNRTEKQLLIIPDETIENPPPILANPRRSRLFHFHLCPDSDPFHIDIDSYVGLLLFSYDNQAKFILNGHHCQRGDILIKSTNFFERTPKSHRELYASLFKWYFARLIDQRFVGIGFFYMNNRWRYDSITFDDRGFLSYEYRLFDMYLFTHWLRESIMERNMRDMEINARNLLSEQYRIVKEKLERIEDPEFLNNWVDFIGTDAMDLKSSTEKFLQTVDKEIEVIFKEISVEMESLLK